MTDGQERETGWSDVEAEPAPPVRGIPGWASALIILLCLGAGSWLTWTFVMAGGAGGRIVVLDYAPGDGVNRQGPDAWRINAGAGVVTVRKGGGPRGQYAFEFFFDRYEFLTPDQVEVLTKTRRLVMDRAFARELGVTPSQMKVLEE